MLKRYWSLFKTAESGRNNRGAFDPAHVSMSVIDVPNNWHDLTGRTPHARQCFDKRRQKAAHESMCSVRSGGYRGLAEAVTQLAWLGGVWLHRCPTLLPLQCLRSPGTRL